MLSYSWGMTSNKRGCEAQTPSLVPPIEASPLLIYSHSGRPNGGVWRPSPNEEPTAGAGDPRRTKSRRRGLETLAERRAERRGLETLAERRAERLGRETLAEPNKFATKAAGIRGRSRPTLQHVRPSLARRAQGPPDGRANGGAIGMVQKRVTTQSGWGRRPEGDAPRSEASALGARWLLPARPQPPSYCHLRG